MSEKEIKSSQERLRKLCKQEERYKQLQMVKAEREMHTKIEEEVNRLPLPERKALEVLADFYPVCKKQLEELVANETSTNDS